MKTIGLIGGITWHSTQEYYRVINQLVNARLGGVASAKIIMVSVNFEDIKSWTLADEWDTIADCMTDAAKRLEAAGADCILLGANTMHKIAGQVQTALAIPVIHIATITAAAIREKGLVKVLLLGTRYTMELPFYRDILAAAGIGTVIPNEAERIAINTAIYEEMGKGIFLPDRKAEILAIISRYAAAGTEGVILGCTEIPVLLKGEPQQIPYFDTLQLHAAAAVDFALFER